MKRLMLLLGVAAVLTLAACGSGARASNGPASPNAGRGAQFRGGTAGQLVQINGQSLILTGAAGDIVVDITGSTTMTRTSVAVLADIVPGTCIVATGSKDASGALTASMVRLSQKQASGCSATAFPGQGPGAGGSPRPAFSPRPSPSGPPVAFTAGQVTAAGGTAITVKTTAGTVVITVPTTAAITKTASALPADLRTGECLQASGQPDASGAIQATSIAITPAGPSGTCTTGFGGRGFGRGAPPAGT
jgi:hypothetical protein